MKRLVGFQVFKVLVVVFCLIFVVTGYIKDSFFVSVYAIEVNNKNSEVIDEVLSEKEANDEKEEISSTEENNLVIVDTPDVESLSQINEITENRIEISNILNDHLMKDYTGEHFYLNHNLNGIYDGRGVPYIDYRTDFDTRKMIIYAHSTLNGSGPFQVLQNYHLNKEYYDYNRYITIYYEGEVYTYEIFSVYVSLADSEESEGLEYFHRLSYSDSDWNDTIQKYKNNSEYDTGVSVSSNDKILILQTCSMDPNYYEQYYRYNLLIMGKLV